MQNRLLKVLLISTVAVPLDSCIPPINPITRPSSQSRYEIPEKNTFDFEFGGGNYIALDLNGDGRFDIVLEERKGMTATFTNGQEFPDSKAHLVARGYEFKGEDIQLLTEFELRRINDAYNQTLNDSL